MQSWKTDPEMQMKKLVNENEKADFLGSVWGNGVVMRWALVLGLMFVGCEDDECFGPVDEPCTPECEGADETSDFSSGDYYSFTCIWHCTCDESYVSITYENGTDGCLHEASRYDAGGICD